MSHILVLDNMIKEINENIEKTNKFYEKKNIKKIDIIEKKDNSFDEITQLYECIYDIKNNITRFKRSNEYNTIISKETKEEIKITTKKINLLIKKFRKILDMKYKNIYDLIIQIRNFYHKNDPRIKNIGLPESSYLDIETYGLRCYRNKDYPGFVWRNGLWYKENSNLKFHSLLPMMKIININNYIKNKAHHMSNIPEYYICDHSYEVLYKNKRAFVNIDKFSDNFGEHYGVMWIYVAESKDLLYVYDDYLDYATYNYDVYHDKYHIVKNFIYKMIKTIPEIGYQKRINIIDSNYY
jgi:hypothetical protein